MGTQNFRVKNGLEVGSATTITTTSAFVGSNLAVAGVSTFQSDLFVAGALTAGTGGASIGDDIVTRNLYVNGISTFVGNISGSSASFTGDVTVGGVLKYEDVVNVDSVGIATARAGLRITDGGLNVVGVSTFVNNIDANGDLDVDGHTELDNVNVSGVSTFTGIGTFQSDLYVGGTLHSPSLEISGGATLGDDLSTRNINVSGIATITGNIDANGDLDVDGHTELDNVNISGIVTAYELDVDGHAEFDNVNVSGIITASSFDGNLNALGKTYYVATTGSDSNSGDNINEPFLTIAQALSVATNGDLINISSGTYEETVPLTVPRGVTVKGSGLRSTTIKPTDATKTNNVFLLNDISTVEDFTVRNSYYNTSGDTGYAFAYAPGIAITTRSPYVQRVTVLNTGSTISATDPYGYDTPDAPPTTYIAGRGALVDGSLVASNSLEAGMLFNEVTFFTPNNKGVVLTNGARAEYLNCFHYFSSQAIVGTSGTVGIAGTAEVRLKFRTPSVTPAVNDVVKLFDTGGSVVAVGTITNYNDPYARISGKGYGTFTSVGIGTTQRVEFYQSDGTTFTGIASAISLADYTMFGAEMRSVGCAVEYGSQGVVADGVGVQLRLFAMNFNHVGTGKDFSNDPTLVVQANEVVETNGGEVSYVSIDQGGDFRVGDLLYINQETGQVSFASTSYDLENIGNLRVTDGVDNTTLITPTSLTVGNLQLAANTFSSVSGDITIDPTGSNKTFINGSAEINGGNFNVSGLSTFTGIGTFQSDLYVGGTLYSPNLNIQGGATVGEDITTRNLSASGIVTVTQATDLNGELNVAGVSTFADSVVFDSTGSIQVPVGNTSERPGIGVTGQLRYNSQLSSFEGYGPGGEWGSLGGVKDVDQDTYIIPEISAGSDEDTLYFYNAGSNSATISSTTATFTGIVTSQGDTFVGNDLSVAGDARIVGVLTIGNSSVTIDGTNNKVNVGAALTLGHTQGLQYYGQNLHSAGFDLNNLNLSGVATARTKLHVGNDTGTHSEDFVVTGDARVTNTISIGSGTITLDGNQNTINVGPSAVIDGNTFHTNQLKVAGVSTFVGVATFQDNVFIAQQLTVESLVVEGGASLGDDLTTRNLTASGIVTVTGATDLNGDLDVDGHTELDNLNVSGVSTFVGDITGSSAYFSGDVTVGGTLKYEDVVNVDAVGIATARAGLRVTGGGLDVVGVSTFNNEVNVTSGNTYQINGTDVLSSTTLGAGVTDSSLTTVGAGVISNRAELTLGQPSGSDYILIYDADVGDLKKSTISNAALQGVQGIQGIQGIQGTQGVQGTQGLQGTQGVQGIQGIQGAQGVQGTQGLQGTQGVQGIQGNQGVQGTKGAQGIQGNQGVQGTQGSQGTYGTQGVQGIQGVQGTQGRQGVQGSQGIQGTTGPVAGSANQILYKNSSNVSTGSNNLRYFASSNEVSLVGYVTATQGYNIGISSNGSPVTYGPLTTLNFIGVGNTFSISGSRADITIDPDVRNIEQINKVLFTHYGGFDTNTTIGSPQKFGEVFTHPSSTVDIESGVTVYVNDGCVLAITDKTDFDMNYYGREIGGTNLLRGDSFDDNIRSVFATSITLGGTQKVGYGKIPSYLQDDITYDIENGVTVTVDDTCVLVL